MKTQSLVLRFLFTFTIGVAFIIMVMLVFSSCKNEPSGAPGTIQLKATSQSQGLKSAKIELSNVTIELQTASIEIKNLQIEENSGEDNQQGNQSGNDGKDKGEKESKSNKGDGGDLLLAGPYLLNVLNNSATIDQVPVQPGTYKKVNFEFFAGSENSNHSISLSGTFTNAQGISVPFTLTSEFAETIQLPLAGSGIQVNSGGISSISILFDVNNWLNKLDLTAAIVNNGQISINKVENPGLYLAFITEVSKHVEIEK